MEVVKTLDIGGCVFEVVSQLPSRSVPTQPLNEVLGFAVGGAEVEYLLDLPLLVAFDFDWWQWWYDLGWSGVGTGWFQEGDMEDRMDLHGWREPKAEGMGADHFDDGEGFQALVVQFLGGEGSFDVLGG